MIFGQQVFRWLLSVLSMTVVLAGGLARDARAHEAKAGDEPAPDTASGVDVTDQVRAFTESLDTVYAPILRRSCYDCHSDTPHYPWYYKIPGIHGMIDNDIQEARKHLDLSKGFPFGGHHSEEEHLSDIRDEIGNGTMPLWTYRAMHWNSLIEGTAQDSVFQWIDSSLALIKSTKEIHGVEDKKPDDDD
jgi:hypothetical protein